MQQPLVVVLGMLSAAGAAKSGHGGWASGGIAVYLLMYISAVATLMMTRRLAAWLGRAAHGSPSTSPTTATNLWLFRRGGDLMITRRCVLVASGSLAGLLSARVTPAQIPSVATQGRDGTMQITRGGSPPGTS